MADAIVIEQPAATETPTGAEKPNGETREQTPERQFSKAEMEAIIKDRLDRQARTNAANEEKARKDAADQALAQQGEYQKLAEERAQRINELEAKLAESAPLPAERDRYKTALETFLAREREGVPAHIATLLDRMDPVDQLEYLAENGGHLKGAAAPPPPTGSVPSTPKADDGRALTEAEMQRRREEVRRQARRAI